MNIVVLDGHALNPGDLSWDSLKELGSLRVYDRTKENQIVERARGAEAVFTNKTPLARETIAQLPELRYIGVLATGYNIIDIQAAKSFGITVTNIPTYGTSSVAQFAIALTLELCHHVGLHSEAVRRGEWSRASDWCFWKTPLVELAGLTMGIVGFGRIGRQTGVIAAALGMNVIVCDQAKIDPAQSPGVRQTTLAELLTQSDVVSLHCPLSAENQGMINRERLQTMRSNAFLINTSRGPLIVDQHLADALHSGVIAGAGLDVLSVEPPLDSNPLLSAPNCIITPHIAWATRAARARLMECAVENFRAFVQGKPCNEV